MGNQNRNFTKWLREPVRRHKGQLICILIFIVLVYFSPFRDAIFTWQFPKNFFINFFERKPKHLDPPLLLSPITHEAQSISGRHSIPKAIIEIFINQKKSPNYTCPSDQEGYFNQEIVIPHTLKPGDLIWIRQTINKEQSDYSPAYKVIDVALLSWYLEKERTRTSSLETTVHILLSWSVLIVGGFFYITIKESKQVTLLYLLIPIVFLFIISIYYGISCKVEIIGAIETGISLSSDPMIDLYWWKQIQIFEQAIFLSAIFFLWNLVSQKSAVKEGSKS